MTAPADADVLIVGGGPAGYATAIELARRDRRVLLVDRGDPATGPAMLVTPRAIAAARRLGVDPIDRCHTIGRLRITCIDGDDVRSLSTSWPRHRLLPDAGCVARRSDLVGELDALARELGVDVLDRHDATEPIIERGFVRGGRVRGVDGGLDDLRATFTVVADGANSQFGRVLGTFREPDWPLAQAHAAEYVSPLHESGEADIVVGVTDRSGTPIAGYGWMWPTGRGTISVGVMLMSTSPSFQVINPAQLHAQLVETHRRRWQIAGGAVGEAAGGRIPLGSSVGPLAGPTYLIVGDAGGSANPFTGLGIETALETGIIAGDVIAEALDTESSTALQQYPEQIAERSAAYYKIGRLGDRFLGRPAVARRTYVAMASRPRFADAALRIATQHLRGVRGGGPELLYRAARTISLFAPDA